MGAYFRDGNANVTKVGGMFQNKKVGGYFGDGHGNSTKVLGLSDMDLPVNYLGYLDGNNVNVWGNIFAEYLADSNLIEVIGTVSYDAMVQYQSSALFSIDISALNKTFNYASGNPTLTNGSNQGAGLFNIYQIGNYIEFDFASTSIFTSEYPNTTTNGNPLDGGNFATDTGGVQLYMN